MTLFGTHQAFTDFYNTHKDEIYGYILVRVNFNHDIAADVVGDIFVKAYESFTSDIGQPRSWVFAIAKNTLIDYYRKSKSESWDPTTLDTLFDETEFFQHELEIDLTIQEVKKHIKDLPPKQRDAVELYYLQDKSTQFIAERQKINLNAVRKNLSRGIQTLRNIYET